MNNGVCVAGIKFVTEKNNVSGRMVFFFYVMRYCNNKLKGFFFLFIIIKRES